LCVKYCRRKLISSGQQHFRNTLSYIQTRQRQYAQKSTEEEEGEGEREGEGEEEERRKIDWEAVDIVGGCLKMGLSGR